MAIVIGKKARVLVGGTLAVVAHIKDKIDYKVTDTLVETTASDSASRTYLPTGLKEATLSFVAQYDATDVPQDALRTNMALLASGTPIEVPLALYPEGTGTGLAKFTGSMCMETGTISAETVDGVVEIAFSFKGAPLTEGLQT